MTAAERAVTVNMYQVRAAPVYQVRAAPAARGTGVRQRNARWLAGVGDRAGYFIERVPAEQPGMQGLGGRAGPDSKFLAQQLA
jgi:hypothetical protein